MSERDTTDESSDERLIQPVCALASPLREIGFAMLGRDSEGRPFAQNTLPELEQNQAYVHERLGCFDSLSRDEQIAVLQVFFGTFARPVSEAWQQTGRGGLLHPPFRAPKNLAATLHARWAWLQGMLALAKQPFQAESFVRRSSEFCGSGIEPVVAVEIDRGDEGSDRLFEMICDRLRQLRHDDDLGEWFFLRQVLLCAGKPRGWQLVFASFKDAVPAYDHRMQIGKGAVWGHPRAILEFIRFLLTDPEHFTDSHVRLNLCSLLGLDRNDLTSEQLIAALTRWLTFIEDPDQEVRAIFGRDHRDVQLGLFAQGWVDVEVAIGAARQLLNDSDPRIRYVAASLVTRIELMRSHFEHEPSTTRTCE